MTIYTRINNEQKEIGFIKTKVNNQMVNIDRIMTKVNNQMECVFEQGFSRTVQGIGALTADGVTYLKNITAYGGTEKRKKPVLWSQYIPVKPNGTYPIKTTNMIDFMPYNKWNGYSLDQSTHPGKYWDNTSGSKSINFPVEANMAYTIKHTVDTTTINRIAEYNGLFPSTEERGYEYPITMRYNSSGALNETITTASDTKSLAIQFSTTYIDTILDELIITENNAEWIAVQDIINNTYGYLNRTTNRYIVTPDMTGVQIKRLDCIQSDGTQYILPNLTGNVKWTIEAQGTKKNAQQIILSSSQTGADATWLGEIGSTGKWGIGDNVAGVIDVDTKAKLDITFSGTGATGTINGFGIANTTSAVHNTWALLATSTGANGFTGKLFSAQAEVDGAIVRDYIPVSVSGVAGLLDTVNWTLNGSEASALVAGAEIPYTLIEPDDIICNNGAYRLENGSLVTIGTPEEIVFTDNQDIEQTNTVVNLNKVGNFIDTHDTLSGLVTKKCGVVIYDGSQEIAEPYISSTGGLDIGAIIVYPLAVPTTETVTAQSINITKHEDYTIDKYGSMYDLNLKVDYKGE